MARPHQVPFRTFLWDYLGHPEAETPARRRVLYAIVALRAAFSLLFLLRGWEAVFATTPGAVALRLGDPARFGLGGAAVDTILFILGCTELGIGALLFFGAFTRVSATTGSVLLVAYLLAGDRASLAACGACDGRSFWFADAPSLVVGLTLAYLAGLLVIVIAGSPFLSADRALDKLEEEERDRAPAVLPRLAERAAPILRTGTALAGLAILAQSLINPGRETSWPLVPLLLGILAVVLVAAFPPLSIVAAVLLAFRALTLANFAITSFVLPFPLIALAYQLAASRFGLFPARSARAGTTKKA